MELIQKNGAIEEDSIAWRYMSFERMYDLLSTNEITFTRLDLFDDPLEGLPHDLKTRIILKRSVLVFTEEFSRPLLENIKKEWEETKITKLDMLQYQAAIYCSCWYLTENKDEAKVENNNGAIKPFDHHENMAMWNLYSKSKGFVLRIKFETLKQAIEESLNDFSDEEINKSIFGKIKYQSITDEAYDHDVNRESSLIKNENLKHEKEIRFILKRKDGKYYLDERKNLRLKLKRRLSEIANLHELSVIAHPDIVEEDFKVYKEKFKEIGISIIHSQIVSRNALKGIVDDNIFTPSPSSTPLTKPLQHK